MKDKINVAVIGLGSWGECHIEAYRSLPHVEVVALCDIRQERLAEIGARYQVEGLYTNSNELLERDDIDLVSIATSEEDHLQAALRALSTGKHVLVEKPVSTKLGEAEAMWKIAIENKRFIWPGHVARFEPRYAEIKRAITSERIGKPQSMYFRKARPKEMFGHYNQTHTVYLSMVHDIDLAIWYSDNRVKSVKAYGKWLTGTVSPDILWSCLEFHDGTLAFLQCNWMTPESAGLILNDSVEVIGSSGTAHFENRGAGFEIWSDTSPFSPALTSYLNLSELVDDALRDQLQYVCSCVSMQKEPSYTSFPDAIHGIEVANAIVLSASTGKEIEL
ncbi:Gfo/Idh/MocA family protein [Cohnella silvisoli]|uniref:Gfo/Idh/MocA family oxidoreductase n=1 Tax=Cohnella silvisoli TaxID=2873699 RepID=A0ABV1L2H2_9BACL|nr:Gfo/Idh/MocA family oxidoreductase [Cohnella silvisoli]MCD9021630.1 Gfo/Idh/MocA family oxidoreductase [Cohnella silvisoli]